MISACDFSKTMARKRIKNASDRKLTVLSQQSRVIKKKNPFEIKKRKDPEKTPANYAPGKFHYKSVSKNRKFNSQNFTKEDHLQLIIANSKKRKAAKQAQNAANSDLTQELDSLWDKLMAENKIGAPKEGKVDDLDARAEKDDYDMLILKLGKEPTAQATVKTQKDKNSGFKFGRKKQKLSQKLAISNDSSAEFQFLEPKLDSDPTDFTQKKNLEKSAKVRQKSMKKKYRKEFRATVADLRKESQTEQDQRQKEIMRCDVERNKKTKDLMRSLKEQQSRDGTSKKGKKRKRMI